MIRVVCLLFLRPKFRVFLDSRLAGVPLPGELRARTEDRDVTDRGRLAPRRRTLWEIQGL